MVEKSSSSSRRNNDNVFCFTDNAGSGSGGTTGSTSRGFVWPMESAEQVIFQVPDEWKDSYDHDHFIDNDNDNNYSYYSYCCKIHYDSINRFILFMDIHNPEIIYDIIDIDDMIGADISIDFTSVSSDYTNNKKNDDNNDANDNVNELPTSLPSHDTKGIGKVTIYVYPRMDVSWKAKQQQKKKQQRSSSSWYARLIPSIMSCKATTTTRKQQQQQPQPDYERIPISSNKNQTSNNGFIKRIENHRIFTLQPVDDFIHVRQVVAALKQLARYDPSSQATTMTSPQEDQEQEHQQQKQKQNELKYLIVVNPCSGPQKNGLDVCRTIVQPMLQQSSIDCDVTVTTHPRHAIELFTKEEFTDFVHQYDGYILIGGDGIIHEVLNGIYQYIQKINNTNNNNTNHNDQTIQFAQTLSNYKFGIVGCGTANGLATSITFASYEHYGPIHETFLIVKGYTVPLDVSHFQILSSSSLSLPATEPTTNNTTSTNTTSTNTTTKASASPEKLYDYISFLTYSWGFISDVDLESEMIRYVGAIRFDIWAAIRFIWLRHYEATFSYLPATSGCNNNNNNNTSIPPQTTQQQQQQQQSSYDHIPAITEPVPSNWKVMDDSFILFWASQVTHAGRRNYNSPPSTLSDGIFQIMIIRSNRITRFQFLMALLGIETGTHVGRTGVEFIECSAFRLVPRTHNNNSNNSSTGSNSIKHHRPCKKITVHNIDGEPVEHGIIQAHIIPSVFNVFARPPS